MFHLTKRYLQHNLLPAYRVSNWKMRSKCAHIHFKMALGNTGTHLYAMLVMRRFQYRSLLYDSPFLLFYKLQCARHIIFRINCAAHPFRRVLDTRTSLTRR